MAEKLERIDKIWRIRLLTQQKSVHLSVTVGLWEAALYSLYYLKWLIWDGNEKPLMEKEHPKEFLIFNINIFSFIFILIFKHSDFEQMCKTFFLFFSPRRLSKASILFFQTSDLRLLIVLHWHGDDVEAYYDGDEQVQVVAGAHLVDEKAGGGVIRVVGLTLSFCWKWEMVGGSWGKGRGK